MGDVADFVLAGKGVKATVTATHYYYFKLIGEVYSVYRLPKLVFKSLLSVLVGVC